MKKVGIILPLFLIMILAVALVSSMSKIQEREKRLQVAKLEKETTAMQLSLTTQAFGSFVFKNTCRPCHPTPIMLHFDLDEALKRTGEKYFMLYVTKQDSLVFSKDEYALQSKQRYNISGNAHNFKLTQQELVALIRYIK